MLKLQIIVFHRIEDTNRIRQIVNLSHDGDPINITLLPFEDSEVIDTLDIPEFFDSLHPD